MIEGAIIQLLSSAQTADRERKGLFFVGVSKA